MKAVQERPLSNFLATSTMSRKETTEELTKKWPKAAINQSDSTTNWYARKTRALDVSPAQEGGGKEGSAGRVEASGKRGGRHRWNLTSKGSATPPPTTSSKGCRKLVAPTAQR